MLEQYLSALRVKKFAMFKETFHVPPLGYFSNDSPKYEVLTTAI